MSSTPSTKDTIPAPTSDGFSTMASMSAARENASSSTIANPSAGRAFKVYKPINHSHIHLPPPPPDDFYTVTAADLKSAQAVLRARTQALVDAPLQLRATREAEDRKKRERWPNTTIRVRFPDQTQLEATFPSTDKIKSVYVFVRASLRDDVKPIKFILSQSPPKRDLKVSDPNVRDMSLGDLQLAPSSVLLLRFEDESLNHSSYPAPLLQEMLDAAIDLPLPVELTAANVPGTPAPAERQSKPVSIGEKKIPKWLKAGLSKSLS
ncbi:hypothetical protein FISHEDRAFT_51336 [Fistulina hepatica ATCC 64428]|uniref:UBX domain-containing protein n=1 Tax=Fistulina hepatica ATCC 64428 TaxID=1128425 RepID=A0A0D7A3F7_9AGAR|nr:hypothetical protein FISHEDRAFT_51336 [Fistulina hepatica ATCC 64428]